MASRVKGMFGYDHGLHRVLFFSPCAQSWLQSCPGFALLYHG